MTDHDSIVPADYTDADTAEPEPTTPPAGDTVPPILEEIPAWANALFNHIDTEFKKVWDDLFEHHHRAQAVISDLRRYSVPLSATAAHYEQHKAPLPAATPDAPTPDAQFDAAANG